MIDLDSMIKIQVKTLFLILDFCHNLNVVFFLMSDSLASELYVLTFWDTVCLPSS